MAPTCGEPERLSTLFQSVINLIPYYNQRAKQAESAKYTADALRSKASADPGSVLVAQCDSQIVGFAFNNLDDDTLWLAWFGVAPDFRNRGVGAGLLQALDRRALSLGVHKVWCDSRTENVESKFALMKHGFLPLCTIPDHWFRQDFILWEKRVG